jgi:hypothetical protein
MLTMPVIWPFADLEAVTSRARRAFTFVRLFHLEPLADLLRLPFFFQPFINYVL